MLRWSTPFDGIPASVVMLLWAGLLPAEAGSFDHGAWSGILARHVKEGRVDYEALLRDRGSLDEYLERVAEADLSGCAEAERKAFWINVYNARMVATVLDRWPLESVLDVGRVLGVPTLKAFREKHRLARSLRSLDDVEHGILRKSYRDARVHAALVCASASCPALAPEAYLAEALDAQLDRAMDGFLRDPTRNRIFEDPPRLSKIFDWYAKDFKAEGGSVWGYVLGRLAPEERARVPGSANPEYLDYDWSLNGR